MTDTNNKGANLSPKDKAEYNAIEEIAQAYYKISDTQSFIKDVCDRLKEEHESNPAELKKLGKIRFKENLEEEREKANAIFDRYDELYGNSED